MAIENAQILNLSYFTLIQNTSFKAGVDLHLHSHTFFV